MAIRSISHERVAKIRKKLGMNVSEFARECNTSRQVIYHWESGDKKPDGSAVRMLELLEELHDERAKHCEGT